jgi:hypothetical protein
MKTRLLRYSAITMATMATGFGLAAAQTASNDTTGPNSDNDAVVTNTNSASVNNDNDVDVDNDTDQDADSGDAEVIGNTNAGDAESGEATNDATTSTTVRITNSSAVGGSFWSTGGEASNDTTGPNSDNDAIVTNTNVLNVRNDNDVDVDNDVDQDADSGDAEVRHNTNGGSATSGGASNTSSVSTTIEISN